MQDFTETAMFADVIAIALAVILAADAIDRVRVVAEKARTQPWHRVALVVALAFLTGSAWCWPAVVAEVVLATEDRGELVLPDPTDDGSKAMHAGFVGALRGASIGLCLAAAVMAGRIAGAGIWGVFGG